MTDEGAASVQSPPTQPPCHRRVPRRVVRPPVQPALQQTVERANPSRRHRRPSLRLRAASRGGCSCRESSGHATTERDLGPNQHPRRLDHHSAWRQPERSGDGLSEQWRPRLDRRRFVRRARRVPGDRSAKSRILTFRYQDLSFDPSATNHEINDAFEASFVDASGNSLVPTFASGRDAFFNITDGQAAALGSGTTLDSSSQRLSVDISSLQPGAVGTLVLRLVNNDQTTKTSVEIVGDSSAPGITAGLLHDTAPSGSTNASYSTDGITTDPTLTGTLTGTVTQLQVQQDGAAFQDITSAISGNQFFYLPPNLAPGQHQFVFEVSDGQGDTSEATVNLTYDLGPNAIIAGLTQTTTGASLTFDASA